MMMPHYVINFPTKRHWRGKSQIEDIESGLHALVEEIRRREIRTIAIPPLGSGLGGLDWHEVRGLMERILGDLVDVDILIFEPLEAESGVLSNPSRNVPKMTPGRATLVGLMDRYLAALLDPFITLLEVHKLMYFMQEAHEPLRLKYVKGPYGPYAENLRHVFNAIEGHMITGYLDERCSPSNNATPPTSSASPGNCATARTRPDWPWTSVSSSTACPWPPSRSGWKKQSSPRRMRRARKAPGLSECCINEKGTTARICPSTFSS